MLMYIFTVTVYGAHRPVQESIKSR